MSQLGFSLPIHLFSICRSLLPQADKKLNHGEYQKISKTNPNNNRQRLIPPKMTPTTMTKITSQNNTHKAMKGVLARFNGGPTFPIAQCVKNFIDPASVFGER